MKDQRIFQKILNEIERIQWEVKRVEKNALMVEAFAEELFQNKKAIGRRRFWRKGRYSFDRKRSYLYRSENVDGSSCLFATNLSRISAEAKGFIHATEYMDLIFKPLVENNPYVLFVYFIHRKGVTRGYPWMDASILPQDFDPTQHSFFYIADERHNPQRKAKWTEPYLCPLIKTWMVTCSIPVYSNSGFIGVIGIDVNLGKIIEPLGQALKMTEKGYAFIISRRGNLIISSEEGMDSLQEDGIWIEGKWKDLKWRKLLFNKASQKRRRSEGTQIREIQLTSGKRYLLYASISTTGWNLVVLLPKGIGGSSTQGIPIREEGAEPNLGQYQTNGVYLPLMSFVSSFSKSLQQMETLIEGTKIIGRGALDHRIKVNRRDEIGLIAHSINKMARELKKRKEEFESAYKKINQLDRLMALGRMAAGIAHEVNNPLGVISNYVQILLRNPSLSGEVKIDLMLIEEEIVGMMGIIKGLLNFSRESEMMKSLININEILRKTVSLLKFQIASQSIQLSEDYSGELPWVLGDPNHLQQVFLNILLNSIQSMPEGGRLGLRTTLADGTGRRGARDGVLIEISDTGIGIESKYLDKIFDPFFTTKGWGDGTGLGLSISYGIIREHGGSIDVKSRPGEGTTVRTVLPVPEKTYGATG